MARPPSQTMEHLLIYARVCKELKSGKLTERNAVERVRVRYYPTRTTNGFWQTWLELSKAKPREGAEPNEYGIIEGGEWKAKTGAKDRMLDLMRLLLWHDRHK